MRLDLPSKIDEKQWLQRLGVKGEVPEGLKEQMQQAQDKLVKAAMPQGIYRHTSLDAIELPGAAIKKHLEGCDEMVILAVTLGAGVERLIRTSQIRDMAEAVILDSGASILVEQICDTLEETIGKETEGFITGRYSPGYGDFPIEMQDQLVKLVDAHIKIGLTVNESHILIPRKSITAIIGIADHPVKGYMATCEECLLRESCVLRKEGRNCAGL